jgi:hypothetical protein
MIESKLADVIANVYEHIFRRSGICSVRYDLDNQSRIASRHADAVLFSVSVTFDVPHELRRTYSVRTRSTFIHTILCGNVHVWFTVGPDYNPMDVPLSKWKNTSNHDSCWRTDGLNRPLSEVYFRFCDLAQDCVPQHQRVAPMEVHTNCFAGGGALGIGSFFDLYHIWFNSTEDEGFVIKSLKPSLLKIGTEDRG